jgi:penicillin-binding protein-related factor A (putative recombinase)
VKHYRKNRLKKTSKSLPKKKGKVRVGREANFLAQLKKDFKLYYGDRGFWYKIPDVPAMRMNDAGEYEQVAATRKKPFDVHALANGMPYAIEGKAHGNSQSWYTKTVQEHQIAALKEYRRSEGFAYVVLVVQYKSGDQKINFAVILTIEEVLARKSYTVDELKSMRTFKRDFLTVNDGSLKKIWDVSKIFDVSHGG